MKPPAPESERNGFWNTLPRPIIGLAPMDGVSDAAFRLVVARQGTPDVSFTEFTSVGDVCRGPDFLLSSLLYHDCERPIVAQLYGKDPDLFYQAAHVVCELGFDGLDINMGCPSHNVASSGSGAGLIRTPERAHAILRAARQGLVEWASGQTLEQAGLKANRIALVRAMNLRRSGCPVSSRRLLPLSVKTRLGYDQIVIEDWVAHLLETEPAVISIHGRTLAQMYRGSADWTAIQRAVDLVRRRSTPGRTLVLGNGDLQSLDDVVRRVRETGVDGVLVGRGTLGAPWFFREKAVARAACRAGSVSHKEYVGGNDAGHDAAKLPPTVMPLDARFEIMLSHALTFESLFGVGRFPGIRKHLGWYCKGFAHAAALRAQMVRTNSSGDVQRVVSEYCTRAAFADADALAPLSRALPCQ
jgi:tRNA-dihydrouridine synthase